jgi:hypothetical protein
MTKTKLISRALIVSAVAVSLPLKAERRAKLPINSNEEQAGEEYDADAGQTSVLFPDWPADRFDWNLGPILGARARKTEFGGVKYDTVSSEIGLGARVHGIPLLPGNPGITIEPYASYTWGSRSVKSKNQSIDETESTGFNRHWYGGLARFYYKAFRYSLDIGQGKIDHDKNLFVDLSSTRFQNDFGLLILPFLSTHYTLTSYTVKEGKESHSSIEDVDHWLHARVAFPFLNFSLDFGPGHSSTEYSGRVDEVSPMQKITSVDTNYLKALTSLNIFWKLGMSGSAKYIVSAEDKQAIVNNIDQLPNENLAENKSLAILPKGSLEANLFFGLRQVFAGFGVGWQLYYLELNNDKSPKQISRDQGLVVTYDAGI